MRVLMLSVMLISPSFGSEPLINQRGCHLNTRADGIYLSQAVSIPTGASIRPLFRKSKIGFIGFVLAFALTAGALYAPPQAQGAPQTNYDTREAAKWFQASDGYYMQIRTARDPAAVRAALTKSARA